jgi:hypothetical protein
MLFYAAMIVFFSFFYTAIVFNPKDTADQLKKHSGFIPGYRPGERTAEYIDYVLTRITVIGAIYLVIVCLLPEFLISQAGVPFYLGGTSLLIVVSVTLDTVAQIQGHLIAHQYEGLIRSRNCAAASGALRPVLTGDGASTSSSTRIQHVSSVRLSSISMAGRVWRSRPSGLRLSATAIICAWRARRARTWRGQAMSITSALPSLSISRA